MTDLKKLALLISKPEHFEYFFKNLARVDLFDWLNDELHVFDYIPEPKVTDDGKHIQFFPWWPGKYLIKVANNIPEKVLAVLKNVKTENYLALDDCARAILQMPQEFLNKNYRDVNILCDKWLDVKFVGFIHYQSADLLEKYISSGNIDGAVNFFEILSKTRKTDRKENEFRFEHYHYEEIVKKQLPKIISVAPKSIIELIAKRLTDVLRINNASDHSSIWRPAIEDDEQNLRHDDVADTFVSILRDAVAVFSKQSPKECLVLVKQWSTLECEIFQRIAIHTIRVCEELADLANAVIMDKSRLFRGKAGYHEFLLLLRDKYKTLTKRNKLEFLGWVIEGPQKDDIEHYEAYKNTEQLRVLLNIQRDIKADSDVDKAFIPYWQLFSDLKSKIPELEHPNFTSFHKSWVGPTSALSKDEIKNLSPEAFIDWINVNLQPPYEMMGPSPEGVARIFQEVVKENPAPYASCAEKFIDKKIWPAYLCGFIRGLEDALKENRPFDLGPVLKFIENPLKFTDEPVVKTRHDSFDIGQYSWVRGAVANFIEAMVRHDSLDLSMDIMNTTQQILVDLVENDRDPTEESEKEYGPDAQNMDYVSYCINCNRGKAMHALMQHALRRARMRPEDEKKDEQGKGPFPAGERMNLYKNILSKRLDEEKSPSVQSAYGQFLPYLIYLDQAWIFDLKKQGKLFPEAKDRSRFWEGHWQGYVGYCDFYDQIYELLYNDYFKATDRISTRVISPEEKKKIGSEGYNRYEDRLAEHLMIAYWRQKAEFTDEKGVLKIFFQKASPVLRGHAISLLGKAIKDVKPTKDSVEWRRLRALWEDRVKKAKDHELANFVRWLQYCPEAIGDIVDLIKPIIPYLHMGYQEEDLVEYLDSRIEIDTISSLTLLMELFKVKASLINMHFRLDLIRAILVKARGKKDVLGVATLVNQAVNRLGEMGYYEFKDLLIKG